MKQFKTRDLEMLSTEALQEKKENIRQRLIEGQKLIVEQKQLLTRVIFDHKELGESYELLDRVIYKRVIGIKIIAMKKRGEQAEKQIERQIEELSKNERQKLLLKLLEIRKKRQLDGNI